MQIRQLAACQYETNLQADGQVHPRAKGSADSPQRQAKVFEELGEGLRESKARPLFCYHHTATYARQIHTSSLKTQRSQLNAD